MGKKDTTAKKTATQNTTSDQVLDRKDVKGQRITTMDTSYYKNMLLNSNVQAFLKIIRDAEGTSDSNGYKTLVGGGLFDDFSKHPNILNKKLKSTAAGAFQINYQSWKEDKKNLKLKDFSPHNQEIATLYEINRKGALNDVLNGDVESAISKLTKKWVSLPGAEHDVINKRSITLNEAKSVYLTNGGVPNGPAQSTISKLAIPVPQNPVRELLKSINNMNADAPAKNLLHPPDMTLPGANNNIFDIRGITETPENNTQINTLAGTPSMTVTVTEPVLVPKSAMKNGGFDVAKVPLGKALQYVVPIDEPSGDNEGTQLPKAREQNKNFLQPPKLKNEWTIPEWDNYFKSIDSLYPIPFTKPGGFGAATEAIKSKMPFDMPRSNPLIEMADKNTLPGNGLDVPDYGILANDGTEGIEDKRASPDFADGGGYKKGDMRQSMSDYKDSPIGRTVNINLNTPMIGSLTISTKDNGAGINDMKQQVESVLLEILNNANAIA